MVCPMLPLFLDFFPDETVGTYIGKVNVCKSLFNGGKVGLMTQNCKNK